LGIAYTESLLRHTAETRESIEALYSFIVLESWTAFECLASDLWAAGVDHGPKEIVARINIAKAKIFEQPDDNIQPETLYEIGINARTHYGSFLKAVGKVSFQKLHKIKAYFEVAFGRDAAKLSDSTDDGYIYALAAFRNVLIHSAAKADKAFVRQAERFSAFRDIKQGDAIELDGEQVKRLSNSAIALGAD